MVAGQFVGRTPLRCNGVPSHFACDDRRRNARQTALMVARSIARAQVEQDALDDEAVQIELGAAAQLHLHGGLAPVRPALNTWRPRLTLWRGWVSRTRRPVVERDHGLPPLRPPDHILPKHGVCVRVNVAEYKVLNVMNNIWWHLVSVCLLRPRSAHLSAGRASGGRCVLFTATIRIIPGRRSGRAGRYRGTCPTLAAYRLPTHRPRRVPSSSRRSPHGAGGRR